MRPTEQLSEIVPALTALVDDIDVNDLHRSTPCDAFSVHDVLDHMVVLGGSFAYWFRGEPSPEISAPPAYGRVPAAEFRVAMEDLLTAVHSADAMERTIATPMGEMPGEVFARFVAFDGLIHGWDLATATGVPFDVADRVVGAVDEFARRSLTVEMRDGDTFKDETTARDDATRLERLAAFSGRTT